MRTIVQVLLSACLLSLSTPVFAETEADPEDIIKYRQDVMNIIKHHNSSIKAIVKGKVPFTDHLDMHVSALETLFAELGRLFPEGSDFGDTSAKDEVWEQPEKFSKAVKDAQQALSTFKAITSKGDMAKSETARKKFSKASCGSCHKAFRKKDE